MLRTVFGDFCILSHLVFKQLARTSLLVQWLTCLPMQEVWVPFLVRELQNPTYKNTKHKQRQYCNKFSRRFQKRLSTLKKNLEKTVIGN